MGFAAARSRRARNARAALARAHRQSCGNDGNVFEQHVDTRSKLGTGLGSIIFEGVLLGLPGYLRRASPIDADRARKLILKRYHAMCRRRAINERLFLQFQHHIFGLGLWIVEALVYKGVCLLLQYLDIEFRVARFSEQETV